MQRSHDDRLRDAKLRLENPSSPAGFLPPVVSRARTVRPAPTAVDATPRAAAPRSTVRRNQIARATQARGSVKAFLKLSATIQRLKL